MRTDVLENWVKTATDKQKQKHIKRFEKYISDLNEVIEEIQKKESADKLKEYARTLKQLIRETQLKINIVKKIKLKKAPWSDFNGSDVHEGDTIVHPNGSTGVVKYYPARKFQSDRWWVNYGIYPESRLCLQIDNKGQAVVVKYNIKDSV